MCIALCSYIGIRSIVLYNFKRIIMNDTHVKTQQPSKYNNTNLIKDTITDMGTKRSIATSKNEFIM